MFCVLQKKKIYIYIYPPYLSKHNSNRDKQVILLMIPNGEGRKGKSEGQWHYLAVKKTITIIKRNNFKHHGNFYYLNWKKTWII